MGGEGDGDDEQITVRLNALGPTVRDVFFSIHIYTKGRGGKPKTFKDVANPYCRVVEGSASGEELCRYMLSEGRDQSGLVIARLRRGLDGRFGFNALGEPSQGTMYKDSIPDMKRMCAIDPRAMQAMSARALRSQTTTSLGAGEAAGGAPLLPPQQVPHATQN